MKASRLWIGFVEVILRVLAAVHLEIQVLISDHAREDQVAAIFRDAAGFTGPVVIAGDFNSQGIGPFWCVTAIAG
ncbi:MAG: hypothetical protein M3Q37_13060 [Gemmatimonadota bacterium]|nr:hypothetical protein [Gemmatimonadota bacterium]